MDPVSEELKAPRPSDFRPSVDLTRGMIHLHAIQNIGRDVFEEAAFRALGGRRTERDDLLWLHAGDGQLNRVTITHPLKLTSKPPAVDHQKMYGRGSARFPVVTLEFHEGAWQMKEQYVYGSLAIREMVLSVLVGTKWPVRFVKRPKGSSHRPPPPQKIANPNGEAESPVEIPRPPRMPTSTHYPVADFFFDNDWAMIARGRGRLVSLTQPYIQIAELEQMPIGIFRQAVQWALGRAPRDGDRLAFTAGEKFQKGDKIKNCLILCPTMPKSRASSLFPKVWMERREGEWVILMSEISGAGAEEMARALVTHPPWNLTTDRPV